MQLEFKAKDFWAGSFKNTSRTQSSTGCAAIIRGLSPVHVPKWLLELQSSQLHFKWQTNKRSNEYLSFFIKYTSQKS